MSRTVSPETIETWRGWAGRLAVAFLVVVACAAGFVREYSGDFHWHVTLGDWTRAHGTIYRLDTLSFTYAGQPMFASAWLADVLLSITFRAGGYPLSYALRALCLATAVLVVVREGRRQGVSLLAAASLCVLVVAETWPQLYLRPEMFSFPCLAATLHLLGEHERTGRRVFLAGGLGVVALWGNLHGSLPIGMLAFGLYGAERAVRALLARERRAALEGLALPVLVYLASCINAEGFRMAFAFLTLGGGCADQNEWIPLRLSMLDAPAAVLFLVAVGAVLAAVPSVSAWRIGLAVAMLLNTLAHRRFLTPTLFVVAFVVLAHVGPAARRLRGRVRPEVSSLGGLVLGLAVLGLALVQLRDTRFVHDVGLGEEPGTYPGAACEFVARRGLRGRVINTYGIGGYLAFCLDGRARVAIDQRACSLYPGDFYQAYKARLKSTSTMIGTFDEMEADWAFVERGPAARALAGAPHRFALLWVDDVVAIYADRTRVELTDDEILVQLEPERLRGLARGKGDIARAARELDLQRSRCADCRVTGLAELALALGRRDEAAYRDAQRRWPTEATALDGIARERFGGGDR